MIQPFPLLQDLMGEIQRLGNFLGENRDQSFYEQLYKRSLFQAMKKNHDNHAKNELKQLYRNGDMTMFRKGNARRLYRCINETP